MGLLGSALGNALGGFGAAAEDLGNRYIDQNLQLQKAQALADLQRVTAGNIRSDEDAFRNDPTRVARDRGNRVADITAEGDARNATALKGKVAEASNADLTQAQVDRENAILKGTTQAKIDATNAVTTGTSKAKVDAELAELNGTMGAKAKAAGMMARASDLNGGERAARTALLNMDVKDKQRLGDLYDKFTAISNDASLTDDQKAMALKPVSTSIQAIKAKNGAGGPARDPELDTETIVDEKLNPDGTTTKTTRKQVRRPGDGSGPAAPYADGTELKGKDGKTYIVQGGKPVLKQAPTTSSSSTTSSTSSSAPADPNSLMSRAGAVVDHIGALGKDYTSPAGKAELQARVIEAQRGGRRLTDVETMRAQQAGIL